MANKANSLVHTKWLCKYHIVFTPKYKRKIIYNQYRTSLQEIIRQLCNYNVLMSDGSFKTYGRIPRSNCIWDALRHIL